MLPTIFFTHYNANGERLIGLESDNLLSAQKKAIKTAKNGFHYKGQKKILLPPDNTHIEIRRHEQYKFFVKPEMDVLAALGQMPDRGRSLRPKPREDKGESLETGYTIAVEDVYYTGIIDKDSTDVDGFGVFNIFDSPYYKRAVERDIWRIIKDISLGSIVIFDSPQFCKTKNGSLRRDKPLERVCGVLISKPTQGDGFPYIYSMEIAEIQVPMLPQEWDSSTTISGQYNTLYPLPYTGRIFTGDNIENADGGYGKVLSAPLIPSKHRQS